MKTYIIYTDGSCKGNPGPGAAAIVVTSPEGDILDEFVKYFPTTTNNRMEMTAAIAALKAAPRAHVTIITDSQYVLKGMTQWIKGWKAKGWVTAAKKPVENQDLWMELDGLAQTHVGTLTWQWVRGHNGTPGNERADELAQQACVR